MRDTDPYVTLLSSLPSTVGLFQKKRPPLSRLRLEQRLRMLAPEDMTTLRLVEGAIDWRRLSMSLDDRAVIARARHACATIANDTLREIVQERLEIRTCVVALRRRARGDGPPTPESAWGFGRWVGQIARNWTDPGFRLERRYPWLREATELIRDGDAVGLERVFLGAAYDNLRRFSERHQFDFEAVVIYVLQWHIADRWTRYNSEAAGRRFADLVETSLGDHRELSFEGAT